MHPINLQAEASEPMSEPPRLVLVFDGDCGFCTWAARWIARVGSKRRAGFRLIPCQHKRDVESLGLTVTDCLEAAWAVEAGGARYRGGGAITISLAHALGWTWLAGLVRVPIMGMLIEVGYWMVVKLRRWLPGVTPHCQQFPDDCRQFKERAPTPPHDAAAGTM